MSEIYEVLAADSFGRYNKKLAKLAGLQTACYWSCLSNITRKVVMKKKFDENGFFKVDRKFITEETTLTLEEQLTCDKALRNLGVLDSLDTDQNKIRVRSDQMLSVLIETDAKNLNAISKATKVSKSDQAASKKSGIIHRLQDRVKEENAELKTLYNSLVEVAYTKGLTTNAQIDLFQTTVDSYTTDVKVKIEILKIAVARGYKQADWAIQIYEQSFKASHIGKQKKATELSDIKF